MTSLVSEDPEDTDLKRHGCFLKESVTPSCHRVLSMPRTNYKPTEDLNEPQVMVAIPRKKEEVFELNLE
jgi:hypothetical protein